ncbi:GyrI-like domain-containing protein [Planctomycetota bacterium]|nr:GyrI-like domain-containing protein [Planctomycetota bacterium]
MQNQQMIANKQVPVITAIAITRKVSVDQISPTAEACVPYLYQTAESINAKITGACTFVYDGSLDEVNSQTYLTMALPVESGPTLGPIDGISPEIHICEIPECACVTLEHHGSMENICSTYQEISEQAQQCQMSLNQSHFREIYHNWIDYSSPQNLTEIQIAVAK